MRCWELLGAVLAWEWHDPELQAVHFLTVAVYNLQHPAQFTDAALAGLRQALIAHLDDGTGVSEIRRRMGGAFAGPQRVLRPEAERRPTLRVWALSIADVYAAGQPSGAADRVRRWAAAIRREL
jgi:hypothetical protein